MNRPAEIPFRNQARLATIKTKKTRIGNKTVSGGQDVGSIVVWLPHLPEEMEFPRENTFENVGSNIATPDGLWIYKSTSPLELSFDFTLNFRDPLCVQGAKTLLDIGARLQAMQMPISNNPLANSKNSTGAASNKAASIQASNSANNTVNLSDEASVNAAISAITSQAGDSSLKFPPACSLRLIQAGTGELGVNCVGFVKSTSVKLHGPYLQTVDQSEGYNLPSAATYRFTFVHNPAYTNFYGSTSNQDGVSGIVQSNAFAADIYNYFYSTTYLTDKLNAQYEDVNVSAP
jgi:hypothetical protein